MNCSCSVNSNSVSFIFERCASVLEVDLRHAKSNTSRESSNKCVFEHKCACVCLRIPANADDGGQQVASLLFEVGLCCSHRAK